MKPPRITSLFRLLPMLVVLFCLVGLGVSLLTTFLTIGLVLAVEPPGLLVTMWLIGGIGLITQGVITVLLFFCDEENPPN